MADLKSRQRTVIAALATVPFPTATEVAERFKFPRQTIYNWRRRDPAFRADLEAAIADAKAEYEAQVEEKIRTLVDEAVLGMQVSINDVDGNVRLKASQWVLERIAGKPKEKLQHEHTGRDGGPIETRETHEFDFGSFERIFSDALSGTAGERAAETDDS